MYVYILASDKYGTLYVGVTRDLVKRVWEHKEEVFGGFTKKYKVKNLVYYEQFDDPENAIMREKKIKNWKRQWKINLIEGCNPHWEDLYAGIAKG